jgi:hypothetical protein
VGQYDYETKADLEGGTATAWERPKVSKIIYKCVIAVTKDDTYIVFPKAQITARGRLTGKTLCSDAK